MSTLATDLLLYVLFISGFTKIHTIGLFCSRITKLEFKLELNKTMKICINHNKICNANLNMELEVPTLILSKKTN